MQKDNEIISFCIFAGNNPRIMEHNCGNCPLRSKYDQNAKMFAARFWRLHINFCPGWKAYFTSLAPVDQQDIRERYRFTKYSA